jgi:CubicO group peptidase (beta-lactamase class C family)
MASPEQTLSAPTSNATLHGTCDAAFRSVEAAFRENFATRGEIGARVTVLLDERTVVDLWGGWADPAAAIPWAEDTLVCSFSVAKAVCATIGHMLVDRGLLDLDAPVFTYWPEFAQAGKEGILVCHVLSHQAALAYVDRSLMPGDLYDWDVMVDALARSRPNHAPGSRLAYLNMTYGYLVGELIRRITGRDLNSALAEMLAGPLGLDWHFGVKDADLHRVARMIQVTPEPLFDSARAAPDSVFSRSMRGFAAGEDFNSLAWRKAQIGSGSIHGNARSIARLFACLARGGELDGVRIMGAERIALATAEQVSGHDPVMDVDMRMALGFELNCPPAFPMGRNPDAFGHWGAGGSFGFADPMSKLSFGYSPNFMHPELELGPRGGALVEALQDCL